MQGARDLNESGSADRVKASSSDQIPFLIYSYKKTCPTHHVSSTQPCLITISPPIQTSRDISTPRPHHISVLGSSPTRIYRVHMTQIPSKIATHLQTSLLVISSFRRTTENAILERQQPESKLRTHTPAFSPRPGKSNGGRFGITPLKNRYSALTNCTLILLFKGHYLFSWQIDRHWELLTVVQFICQAWKRILTGYTLSCWRRLISFLPFRLRH